MWIKGQYRILSWVGQRNLTKESISLIITLSIFFFLSISRSLSLPPHLFPCLYIFSAILWTLFPCPFLQKHAAMLVCAYMWCGGRLARSCAWARIAGLSLLPSIKNKIFGKIRENYPKNFAKAYWFDFSPWDGGGVTRPGLTLGTTHICQDRMEGQGVCYG